MKSSTFEVWLTPKSHPYYFAVLFMINYLSPDYVCHHDSFVPCCFRRIINVSAF